MVQVFASVAALLFGMAFMSVGNGLLGVLVSLRLGEAGSNAFTVGLVMAGFFLGLVVGVPVGRRLITRVGHIRAFTAFTAVFAAAILSHPFLLNGVFWFFLRLIQGTCLAGLYMCTESWLNERATSAQRGQVLSLYMITLQLCIGGGQLLVNLPDPSGFGLFAVVAILMSLAAVPVAAARITPPALPEAAPLSFKQLYEISPLGVVGAFAAGVILGAFYGLGPYFTHKIGMDTAATSEFMAGAVFGGLLLQWPVGRLSDRFDRRLVIIVLTAATFAVSATIVAISLLWTTAALIFLAPILGGAIFTLYPLCVAHTNDYVDTTDLVSASAGLILAYGIGSALGPVAASGAMTAVGPFGLFGFIGLVGLAGGLYAQWRRTQRDAPPEEEQVPFQPLPRTTPLAAELDPRGEPSAETVIFPFPEPDQGKDERENGGEDFGAGDGNRTHV